MVGITGADPSAFAAEYRNWITQRYAGEMEYLARNLERRLDPRELLPNARSIIVVGMNYYTEEETGEKSQSSILYRQSTIERFLPAMRGDDYLDVMTARLKELLIFLKEQASSITEGVDG